jgi:hypothetical protein
VDGRAADATLVLVRNDIDVISWVLGPVERRDLTLVDGLARMMLAAQRLDCRLELRSVCVELVGLLELVGLQELVTSVAS